MIEDNIRSTWAELGFVIQGFWNSDFTDMYPQNRLGSDRIGLNQVLFVLQHPIQAVIEDDDQVHLKMIRQML